MSTLSAQISATGHTVRNKDSPMVAGTAVTSPLRDSACAVESLTRIWTAHNA